MRYHGSSSEIKIKLGGYYKCGKVNWQQSGGRNYRQDTISKTVFFAGALGTCTIIQSVWSQWQLVWIERNETIDGYERRERSKRSTTSTSPIYASGTILPEENICNLATVIFSLPPLTATWLQRSTNLIVNWINIHKAPMNHSVQEADRLAIRGVRSVRISLFEQPS